MVERVQRRTGRSWPVSVETEEDKGAWGCRRTEEHVLEHDRLLGEPAKVARVIAGGLDVRDRLALDARPGEVDVEEQEEDAEADDGPLCFQHIRSATCPISPPQAKKQNLPRTYPPPSSTYYATNAYTPVHPHTPLAMHTLPKPSHPELRFHSRACVVWCVAHLRLDQDQVDEQHDKVVLDVLVAEAPAVLAHGQPDVVPARLVAAALAPERLDGVPALYADGHCGGISGGGVVRWLVERAVEGPRDGGQGAMVSAVAVVVVICGGFGRGVAVLGAELEVITGL